EATIDPKEFHGIQILLAEDNAANQFVAQELLEGAGFILDIAENGKFAVEKTEGNNNYALILMDMQMPEMDGLEATKIIREKWSDRELPIIALTANAMKADAERCIEAGMNDFVSKPIDRLELFKVLRKWIDKDSKRSKPKSTVQIETDSAEEPPTLDHIDINKAMARLDLPWQSIKKLLIQFAQTQP
ncbi:MAG: response regulator, partial [Euryarchaeota archaeon]